MRAARARHAIILLFAGVLMGLSGCELSPAAIAKQANDLPDVAGGSWGISVRRLDGATVYDVNGELRVSPASTQKLITSAAAFHYLGNKSNAGWPRGTALYLRRDPASDLPDLVLRGTGDPTLSALPDCTENCLQDLADAVKAAGITQVRYVIGDDRLFEPAHWPAGWSQDDLRFSYGTAISALSTDGGAAFATVSPGLRIGAPVRLDWTTPPAFRVDLGDSTTSASGGFDLDLQRRRGDLAVLSGSMPIASPPVKLEFGLDDPAAYAAQLLQGMLAERGVAVTAAAGAQLIGDTDQLEPIVALPAPDPSSLIDRMLTESDNQYSEVLLHHISLSAGDRSQEEGVRLLGHILLEAGAEETDFNIADGSGLSVYNRLTPDAMTRLLVWSAHQEWFADWFGLIASGGSKGTLQMRLADPAAASRIRAKTGSLFGANGLAGYFDADSGERYAFAIYIDDSALSNRSARRLIDDQLLKLIDQL